MLIRTMLTALFFLCAAGVRAQERIEISSASPWHWQYKGRPVLLLGGSVEDNLFQIAGLKEHLDLLASVGGNYVRNTMSSRDEGNLWPFAQTGDGRYDLRRMNPEYWQRFENLLALARERDIIVQIEVWDRFDFARGPWRSNPFNPAKNRNYTEEESGLQPDYPNHPGSNENPFFRTVPALDDNRTVLRYQQAFVDTMLSISLRYPNVLYCIDNETSASPLWGRYWAEHIRRKAREKGITVHVTEMWDAWEVSHPMHRATFDHPEEYSFVDVSQNNHQKGERHWEGLMWVRRYLSERPRPINNVKVYGSDAAGYGSDRDGLERFWRCIFAGAAAVRFHRPPAGQGLGEKAQASLRSARLLLNELPFTKCLPANQLLGERSENEAYCLAEPGKAYAVFFPGGGEVTLDISLLKRGGRVRWLDIAGSRWHTGEPFDAGARRVALRPPGDGLWVALVR